MPARQIVDRIAYSDPFRQNVQGRLKARFRLDADGAPVYEPYPDDRRLRVYTIDLFLETPLARMVRQVHYYLDDESYIYPDAYSDDADNQFQEEITSYGEVEVVVTVTMKAGPEYRQRAWLSNMLENGHAGDLTPAIRDALERIKVN